MKTQRQEVYFELSMREGVHYRASYPTNPYQSLRLWLAMRLLWLAYKLLLNNGEHWITTS